MKLGERVRTKWNNILQGGIRLCLMTAVAFTVTACYAPVNNDWYEPTSDKIANEDSSTDSIRNARIQRQKELEERIARMHKAENKNKNINVNQ